MIGFPQYVWVNSYPSAAHYRRSCHNANSFQALDDPIVVETRQAYEEPTD